MSCRTALTTTTVAPDYYWCKVAEEVALDGQGSWTRFPVTRDLHHMVFAATESARQVHCFHVLQTFLADREVSNAAVKVGE